jgi:hypothetical protein
MANRRMPRRSGFVSPQRLWRAGTVLRLSLAARGKSTRLRKNGDWLEFPQSATPSKRDIGRGGNSCLYPIFPANKVSPRAAGSVAGAPLRTVPAKQKGRSAAMKRSIFASPPEQKRRDYHTACRERCCPRHSLACVGIRSEHLHSLARATRLEVTLAPGSPGLLSRGGWVNQLLNMFYRLR